MRKCTCLHTLYIQFYSPPLHIFPPAAVSPHSQVLQPQTSEDSPLRGSCHQRRWRQTLKQTRCAEQSSCPRGGSARASLGKAAASRDGSAWASLGKETLLYLKDLLPGRRLGNPKNPSSQCPQPLHPRISSHCGLDHRCQGYAFISSAVPP